MAGRVPACFRDFLSGGACPRRDANPVVRVTLDPDALLTLDAQQLRGVVKIKRDLLASR